MSVRIDNPFLKPLSSQRYFQAFEHIKALNTEFIIDIGCSDCSFLFYLSQNPYNLKFSIGLDKDVGALNKGSRNLSRPQLCYPHTRKYIVSLMKEDVTNLSKHFVNKYKNCPFVTAIELIEHLDFADLILFNENVFGKLQPEAVFVTTPNIEYNDIITSAFGRDKKFGQFRHPDHRFEFTRTEFRSWCDSICSEYGYYATISGVGKCIEDDDGTHGFASHSALFTRKIENKLEFSPPENPLHEAIFYIKLDDPKSISSDEDNDIQDEKMLIEEEEEEEEELQTDQSEK